MSRDSDSSTSIGVLVGYGLIAEGHLDGYRRVPQLDHLERRIDRLDSLMNLHEQQLELLEYRKGVK